MAAILIGAPTAYADDVDGYISALDEAGLIDHDGDRCNIIDDVCHGQFAGGPASVDTGAVFFKAMGHDIMLEPGCHEVTKHIDGWLVGRGV